jgi:hypothetical protein
MDDLWERRDVQRELTRRTIGGLEPRDCGETEPLKEEFAEALSNIGIKAHRIFEPEADVEAQYKDRTYYFQIRWLCKSSEEITPAERVSNHRNETRSFVWDKSLPTDSYFAPNRPLNGESSLRHFAQDRDGVPVMVLRWDEDKTWYFLYQQISDYGDYITIDDLGWIPVRVHREFTPLPTFDDFQVLILEEADLGEIIEEKLEDFYSSQSAIRSRLT